MIASVCAGEIMGCSTTGSPARICRALILIQPGWCCNLNNTAYVALHSGLSAKGSGMRKFVYTLIGMMLLALAVSGCDITVNVPTGTPTASTPTTSTSTPKWGVQTKTSGCQVQG